MSSVTIGLEIPFTSNTVLTMHDLTGRRVASIADGILSAGQHSIVFSIADYPEGVYVIRAAAAGTLSTKAVLILD